MSAPRWAAGLLRRLAPPGRAEDLLGDLEEVHRTRLQRHSRAVAGLLTGLEALGMALALLRYRMFGASYDRPRSASRKARLAAGPRFGSVSWLDVKLGLRMLVKYPGLTVVGGFAIAVAIGLGAAVFEFLNDVVRPSLPLDEGDRIVGIANESRLDVGVEVSSLSDFQTWRAELRSIEDVGAFAPLHRNLITEDGRAEPTNGVLISASGFRVARVPPLLGRTLIDADESPAAPSVVVIGHRWWQSVFGGDPWVIGRTVKVSGTPAVVVGVMPERFGFPVDADLWMPLSADIAALGGAPPRVSVFGRLADGATRARAQAELSAIGERSAAVFPDTHGNLRPRVMTLPGMIMGEDFNEGDPNLALINFLFVLLLIVVAANVATLVFARTLSRAGEMAVRTALGAGRGRIVLQLFAEALVLGSVAALVGLTAAGFGVSWGMRKAMSLANESGPFCLDTSQSPRTVLYDAGLTVLGSAIVGVLPALKLTGSGLHSRLRQETTGGARFGRTWTVVIVAQVALTVALLPHALSTACQAVRFEPAELGVPAEQYLVAVLHRESETETGAPQAPYDARWIHEEMARRFRADPLVSGVTFASAVPGYEHARRRIEVEGMAAPILSGAGQEIRVAEVAPDYFDELGMPVVTGRAFGSADAQSGTVIVNESFVREVLRGQNAIGRRVRYLSDSGAESSAWHEIVGVVADLGMSPEDPANAAGLYHPLVPRNRGYFVVLRLQGDPASYVARLRAVAAAVDPMLRPNMVLPLSQIGRSREMGNWLRASLIGLVASITMLLATAGIFALTSFTVAQRTREIGIRTALGGEPRRIVRQVFSRVAVQLAIGVAIGAALTVLPGYPSDRFIALVSVVGFVGVAGLLACGVPVRRALRVEPTEALRADG